MPTARDAKEWAASGGLHGIGDSLYTPFSGIDGDDIDGFQLRSHAQCFPFHGTGAIIRRRGRARQRPKGPYAAARGLESSAALKATVAAIASAT